MAVGFKENQMPFQKGKRIPGQGGRRENAGRPTKAEAEAKSEARKIIESELKRQARRLATRYLKRALGKRGDRVLTHAVERIVPAAKQEVELSGNIGITIKDDDDGNDV